MIGKVEDTLIKLPSSTIPVVSGTWNVFHWSPYWEISYPWKGLVHFPFCGRVTKYVLIRSTMEWPWKFSMQIMERQIRKTGAAISPFSIYRLMLDHPPLNTIWKGKVMLVYWERTIEGSVNQTKDIWPQSFHGESIGMKRLRATWRYIIYYIVAFRLWGVRKPGSAIKPEHSSGF